MARPGEAVLCNRVGRGAHGSTFEPQGRRQQVAPWAVQDGPELRSGHRSIHIRFELHAVADNPPQEPKSESVVIVDCFVECVVFAFNRKPRRLRVKFKLNLDPREMLKGDRFGLPGFKNALAGAVVAKLVGR